MKRPLVATTFLATLSCASAPSPDAPKLPIAASTTAGGLRHARDADALPLFAAVEAKNAAELGALLDREPALVDARDAKGRSLVLAALFTMKDKESFLPPQDNACLTALLARRPLLDAFETAAVGSADGLALWLAKDPAAVRAVHPLGWTPLHFAAFGGNVPTAELLLAKGAELDAVAKNDFRNTPLQVSLLTVQERVLAMLVARGANVNAKQNGGVTALHEAAQSGQRALVTMLLDAGADPSARTLAGGTPLDVALKGKHDEAAALLRARGANEGTGKLE